MIKKADNKEIKNNKKIEKIDLEISEYKSSLNNLDNMEYNLHNLKINFDKCIELVDKSMKGPEIKKFLYSLSDDNNRQIDKFENMIEADREKYQTKIKKLSQEKESLKDSKK